MERECGDVPVKKNFKELEDSKSKVFPIYQRAHPVQRQNLCKYFHILISQKYFHSFFRSFAFIQTNVFYAMLQGHLEIKQEDMPEPKRKTGQKSSKVNCVFNTYSFMTGYPHDKDPESVLLLPNVNPTVISVKVCEVIHYFFSFSFFTVARHKEKDKNLEGNKPRRRQTNKLINFWIGLTAALISFVHYVFLYDKRQHTIRNILLTRMLCTLSWNLVVHFSTIFPSSLILLKFYLLCVQGI